MEDSGVVTLIFYKIDKKWWNEPALNLLAAAAQWSKFTHVEVAIGDGAGRKGEMTNVCRVFNDNVGCELAARTGRNPNYSYIQLGCSKAQEQRMLRFAASVVGRPFSSVAMARSIFWPRKTDNTSFFCAELVAAVLKEGGMLDRVSNPGAATPQGLYDLYHQRATATANPYLLRQAETLRLTTQSIAREKVYVPPSIEMNARARSAPPRADVDRVGAAAPIRATTPLAPTALSPLVAASAQRGGYTALRVLNEGEGRRRERPHEALGLSLNSLTFRR